MSQSLILKAEGQDIFNLMLKNEWPEDEAMGALNNLLGWDMTATIESTATSEERRDPRNWQLTMNFNALFIRRFHFPPTEDYAAWCERADKCVPTEQRTWPKLKHKRCKFGDIFNCVQNGGWGDQCQYLHYNEKAWATMVEEVDDFYWSRLQLAPGLRAVNEPELPKQITDLSPHRGVHTDNLVLGNFPTLARFPDFYLEELRAHLEVANINPLDVATVHALGQGYLDSLKENLCTLGRSGVITRVPPAIAQSSTAREVALRQGAKTKSRPPTNQWIDYTKLTPATAQESPTESPTTQQQESQASACSESDLNMVRGTEDGDKFNGIMTGFRVGEGKPSQLSKSSNCDIPPGPLSVFAKTGLVDVAQKDPTLNTGVKTKKPELTLRSLALPPRGVQSKELEEVTAMTTAMTSEIGVLKFKIETLTLQNSALVKKNEKMEIDLKLVTKLLLVLGQKDYSVEMETLVKDSEEEHLKLANMEPLTLDQCDGEAPLAQMEPTETAATTAVPRP